MTARGEGGIRGRLRAAGAALTALALTAALAACSGGLSDDGEPLTPEQAQTLGQARFQLSTADEFGAEISVGADDATDHYVADVTVAHREHLAWGELERGPEGLAVSERIAFSPAAVITDPGSGWQAASGDYSALAVVFALVADRPENAELLRQSDARYLGRTDLDGTDADVYRMPSPDGEGGSSRLWLDGSGAALRLDDGGDGLVVTLGDPAGGDRPDGIAEMLGTDAE